MSFFTSNRRFAQNQTLEEQIINICVANCRTKEGAGRLVTFLLALDKRAKILNTYSPGMSINERIATYEVIEREVTALMPEHFPSHISPDGSSMDFNPIFGVATDSIPRVIENVAHTNTNSLTTDQTEFWSNLTQRVFDSKDDTDVAVQRLAGLAICLNACSKSSASFRSAYGGSRFMLKVLFGIFCNDTSSHQETIVADIDRAINSPTFVSLETFLPNLTIAPDITMADINMGRASSYLEVLGLINRTLSNSHPEHSNKIIAAVRKLTSVTITAEIIEIALFYTANTGLFNSLPIIVKDAVFHIHWVSVMFRWVSRSCQFFINKLNPVADHGLVEHLQAMATCAENPPATLVVRSLRTLGRDLHTVLILIRHHKPTIQLNETAYNHLIRESHRAGDALNTWIDVQYRSSALSANAFNSAYMAKLAEDNADAGDGMGDDDDEDDDDNQREQPSDQRDGAPVDSDHQVAMAEGLDGNIEDV